MLPHPAGDLRRTVLDFEAWKLVRFVRSGVFPKRYFGYLDRRNDTAALEGRLRDITRRVVAVSNAYQAERGHPVRISDLEVVVTFLAEGGAILLRERQDLLGRLHPVFEVGLDDVALGFSDLPGLQARIDREAGTDLQGLVGWADTQVAALAAEGPVPRHLRLLKHPHGDGGPHAYLRRFMTFEEAVAGTALMYLWEKEIAARKLLNQGLPPLERRSLEEQFVIASLVYNSGRLHVPERWRQIQAAATAAWLVAVSDRNAPERPRLDVTLPAEALAGLCAGQGYPEQPTSWVAVYHVLQRHGAFVALRNFSDHFDDSGFFRAGETGTE
ncbi:MAG TPA: hypothetical protein P5076_22185 [Myxococcota bacterium]|nr:hypothetical protein [Myxococcota bacterium]